jgi:hypothetical protein
MPTHPVKLCTNALFPLRRALHARFADEAVRVVRPNSSKRQAQLLAADRQPLAACILSSSPTAKGL